MKECTQSLSTAQSLSQWRLESMPSELLAEHSNQSATLKRTYTSIDEVETHS